MSKSAYSLILSDEVVRAVDSMAARKGYSRSALIDHALAEYTGLFTTEQKLRGIVQQVQCAMEEQGLRTEVSARGALTIRTALRYRYNPAVSYVVHFTPHEPHMGEVRVALRTQNEHLLQELESFFSLWDKLEQNTLPVPPPSGGQRPARQRYVRSLRRTAQSENTADAVASYVSLLDDCLKLFFDADDRDAGAQVETVYRTRLALSGPVQEL